MSAALYMYWGSNEQATRILSANKRNVNHSKVLSFFHLFATDIESKNLLFVRRFQFELDQNNEMLVQADKMKWIVNCKRIIFYKNFCANFNYFFFKSFNVLRSQLHANIVRASFKNHAMVICIFTHRLSLDIYQYFPITYIQIHSIE